MQSRRKGQLRAVRFPGFPNLRAISFWKTSQDVDSRQPSVGSANFMPGARERVKNRKSGTRPRACRENRYLQLRPFVGSPFQASREPGEFARHSALVNAPPRGSESKKVEYNEWTFHRVKSREGSRLAASRPRSVSSNEQHHRSSSPNRAATSSTLEADTARQNN